jgi:hypothetical protein
MESQLLDLLTKYWTIIFFIGSLIWSYANLKGHVGQLHSRVKTNEEDIDSLKKDVKEMSPIWTEIKERLVRIETSIQIHFKDK